MVKCCCMVGSTFTCSDWYGFRLLVGDEFEGGDLREKLRTTGFNKTSEDHNSLPSLPEFWIAFRMKYSNYHNSFGSNCVINDIWKLSHKGFPSIIQRQGKNKRVLHYSRKSFINTVHKFSIKPCFFASIPLQCVC